MWNVSERRKAGVALADTYVTLRGNGPQPDFDCPFGEPYKQRGRDTMHKARFVIGFATDQIAATSTSLQAVALIRRLIVVLLEERFRLIPCNAHFFNFAFVTNIHEWDIFPHKLVHRDPSFMHLVL